MNSTDLDKWRKAAAIAAITRDYVASSLEPGVKLIDISLEGHRRIEQMGGEPAFPLQISRNHIAAHYCAFIGDTTECQEGDLIKVDCGVHIDGFVADTAVTVDLSSDGRHSNIREAAREALAAAIKVAGPEVNVADIGRAVENAIQARKLNPIENLTGHGVGRWIVHSAPQIPNVPAGRGKLKAGTCVAIEPFATDGTGLIHEKGDAHVFMARKSLKKARGTDAKVLASVRSFNGLPFSSRDLVQKHPYRAVADTLNALSKNRQLMIYPPLCEKEGSFVAQFEHTLYISDNGAEILTVNPENSAIGSER